MAAVLGLGVSSLTGCAAVGLLRQQRCCSSWRGERASVVRQVGGSRPVLAGCGPIWRGKERFSVRRMAVDVDDSATEGTTSTDEKIEEEIQVPTKEETDEAIKQAIEDLEPKRNPREGLEERYLVVNSGKSECRSCGYVYDTEKGDSNYPIAGGIPFTKLPEDWRCPTCGAAKSYFDTKGVEVAGFAQNQSYGLGGNSMTESQKSLLIYGSLLFFFCLFLSGYFLQ